MQGGVGSLLGVRALFGSFAVRLVQVVVVVIVGVQGSVFLGLFRVEISGVVSPPPLGGGMGMCFLVLPGCRLPGRRFFFRLVLARPG